MVVNVYNFYSCACILNNVFLIIVRFRTQLFENGHFYFLLILIFRYLRFWHIYCLIYGRTNIHINNGQKNPKRSSA